MKVVVFIGCAFWIVMPLWAQQQVVADPAEVRGPCTLVTCPTFRNLDEPFLRYQLWLTSLVEHTIVVIMNGCY